MYLSKRRNVENGKERGASVAFYHKGELLVDLWGGFGDEESGKHWRNNTISQMYSASKGVGALLAAIFVDRYII